MEDVHDVRACEGGSDGRFCEPLCDYLERAAAQPTSRGIYSGGAICAEGSPQMTYTGGAVCVHEAPVPRSRVSYRPPRAVRKVRPLICSTRTRPRARGHRPRRRAVLRSTARSGDSGEPGEPAGLRLARDLIAAGLSTGEAARVVADAEYDAPAAARLLREQAAALESLAADYVVAAEAVAT